MYKIGIDLMAIHQSFDGGITFYGSSEASYQNARFEEVFAISDMEQVLRDISYGEKFEKSFKEDNKFVFVFKRKDNVAKLIFKDAE